MPEILVFRHAPTDWNAAKRIQGRADIPLSEAGREEAARWRLPDFAEHWPCLASPLRRAVETARLMGLAPVPVPAFIEMDWGRCDGATLVELREAGGAAFAANEALGLDFRPAGGESPREVGARALAGLACIRRDTVIATHKGVIRALMALATGWDMRGKAPVRFEPASAHRFRFDGALTLLESNISLVRVVS